MRLFVLRAVVNSAMAAVILFVLGLIPVAQPFPFGSGSAHIVDVNNASIVRFLFGGVVLAIADDVVRPLIIALTGRFLLQTGGLFMIVVNAIVLWVSNLFVRIDANVAQPFWFWILVFAALFTVLSTFSDALLGLNRPIVDEQGRGAFIWRVLDTLPTPRRNQILENFRLQEVYDTIYAYGLDIALGGTPVQGVRGWVDRVILRRTDTMAGLSTPAKVRIMLQQLGPTYVKIGQMVASRGEALPPEWLAELTQLQSNVAPFPADQVRGVFVDQFKKGPEELFGTFEPEPFAAASTAQVHRATLRDGTELAVKVQRPLIVAKTKADLGVMQEIAKTAEKRFEYARRLDARGIVAEFAAGVIDELDYRNEAYNARRLADGMARFAEIHIPIVYGELSSERVLTMEFVRGVKISDVEALRAAGIDTTELGNVFVRALIKQVLIDGFFHGDPHPGNILVDPETGSVRFIDCGLVGQLNQQQRIDLLDLIYGLKNVDSDSVATAVINLSKKGPYFDEPRFREELDRVLRRYLLYGEGSGSIGDGMGAVQSVVYNNGLKLNNDLTLAIKAVIQAEQTATLLNPRIDIAAAALEEARANLITQVTPENIRKNVERSALRIGREVVRRVPDLETAAFKWMDQFGRGRFVIDIDTADLTSQLENFNQVGRRLTMAIIVVGQLIGSAILAVLVLQPSVSSQVPALPQLAALVFGGVLIFSFVVLRRVWIQDNPDDH